MNECTHENFGYFPAINEAGWKCFGCKKKLPGEPDGYRPDLDRSHLQDNVYGLMNDLHEHDFIWVSNSEYGEHILSEVMTRCREAGLYDQITIMHYILEANAGTHAEFWKEIGDGVVSGNDPRDRCDCGKLATTYTSNGKSCSEHGWRLFATA
jgi:hypothetical protein